MKKKVVILSVALAVCMLVFVVVCVVISATGPGYFRATFELEDGSPIEFYKDGKVEIYGRDDMFFEGTYERTEKNTYELRINALIVQIRYTAVRDGDTLTLTNNSDENKVYIYSLKK